MDHLVGKNNKFMLASASPLAAIYISSTMEHHFNKTVIVIVRITQVWEWYICIGLVLSIIENERHVIIAPEKNSALKKARKFGVAP